MRQGEPAKLPLCLIVGRTVTAEDRGIRLQSFPMPLLKQRHKRDVPGNLPKVFSGWRLHLAPHQDLEGTRAVEGPDVAKATYRAVVNEDVRQHYLVVENLCELHKQSTRAVVSCVDDLDIVAPSREEASCSPASPGPPANVERHLPLIHLLFTSLLAIFDGNLPAADESAMNRR